VTDENTNGQAAASSNQKAIYILLGLIIGLMVVILAIIVWPEPDLPAPTASVPAEQPAAAPSAAAPAGVAPAEVDPNSATKVTEGTDPGDFASEYYELVLAGDYETAFYMQPIDRQAGSTPADFQAQLEGYGITGYELVSAVEEGEQYVVVIDQITGFGTFENTWVFTSDGEGGWFVASKEVSQMK
jgi:hypothetical protein